MERTYTFREMLEALNRRRRVVVGVAAVVLLASAVVIAVLPPEYRAESVMQIEPHLVPADFLPTSVTSFEERMRTLKHGLLARPVLERVLNETDFYPDLKREPDEAIERLRRNVEVRLEGEVAGGPPSLLFVVEVRGKDRDKVARAADLIPRIYADLTRQVFQSQARNLRDTLARQLEDLSRRLTTEEEKLVAFKGQHATEVPEANETNLRLASALTAQLDMRAGSIAEAQRRRTALFASIPEPTSDAGLAGGNAEDVLRRLEAARAAYGSDHPDVRRLERQYQEVSNRSSEEMKRFRRERLDDQVARIYAEIRDQEAAVGRLRTELAAVQKRLDAAPRFGEQYRALARDYETIRAKYTTTLARAADAQSAELLLAADSPNLFRVVQAALAPSRPAGPNRLNLALIALAAALGASLLAAAASEYFDSSLRGPQDASAFGVPVLASIPRIGPRRIGAQR
jgi:succinoglycan biosynthesis transport protein ExoP